MDGMERMMGSGRHSGWRPVWHANGETGPFDSQWVGPSAYPGPGQSGPASCPRRPEDDWPEACQRGGFQPLAREPDRPGERRPLILPIPSILSKSPEALCRFILPILFILSNSLLTTPAGAQALPRLTALYPPGARAGSTLDVAIRGGGLDGAQEVVVDGAGLKVELNDAGVKVNPEEQKVFQAKCGLCHELRGPANISRTADQWVATVDRMIRDRGAPIEPAERAKIVGYVQAAARASAGLTARVTVAPDAAPGVREIRVVGTNGTSTAYPFEVTHQPEALEVEPNNEVTKAPLVPLPITVSGQLAAGDADCFAFQAKQGERLVFNCRAFRLNPASQAFFFPVLYLYDESGRELVRNNGYFSLDPLIDWTAPADGKYVVMVRDMLYRGSPGSVYRLSMGALPYKTYLFPPGGRRGETAAVTLHGENVTPAALQVPVAEGAPAGLRRVPTPHGVLPFVAGDYPEFIKRPEPGPQPVALPVSINGRVDHEEAADRYPFTLTPESLGAYTFELFAERIGSPLVGRLVLHNGKGQSLASDGGAGRDARIDYNFTQPGDYVLEVVDAAGKHGPAHVYRVSAGPAAPDFALTVSPDNPNLGPGSSVYLQVRVQRRVGITGEIEVTFSELPPGVTASPVVLRPNENQAFAVLTAAPDAKPGAFSVTGVTAKSVAGGRTITREVVPYEVYRINNAQTAFRANMVVTVGPEAEWTVALEPGAMKMSADGGPVEVRARLTRKGNNRDLPFAIVGVPAGIEAPRAILFKRGADELTFTMKPTSGGVFAPRSGNQPPPPAHFLLAVVNGREGDGMMMASRPVTVALTPPVAQP
jgi:hypothetical protein